MSALLLFAAAASHGLAPLQPLIGHCWRSAMPGGATDTHCFRQTSADKVVDRHEVVKDGKTVYWGETDYVDGAAGLRWAYRNARGPVMAGGVRGAPGAIRFTVDGGAPLVWRWRGADRYLAEVGPKGEAVEFRRVR